MRKETEKVRRWREQQRVQGRRSLTLWLEGETVERLHARAQTLGVTVPDLIVRMVTDTVTATTENEVTDTITVTSLTPTDTLRQAIRDELGHALTQVADNICEEAIPLPKRGQPARTGRPNSDVRDGATRGR
jgi:hypothetical protein